MFKLFKRHLDRDAQERLLDDVRSVIKDAPLICPTTKSGKKFNLKLSNCGSLGWLSDSAGYRYSATHPETGKVWPEIPVSIRDLSVSLAKECGFETFQAQSCLINHYDGSGKLGLHQDKDEANLHQPIVSISLGDDCIFQFGGVNRDDPIKEYLLESGDCVVWGSWYRLAFHGVKHIIAGSSNLLPNGGRLNLTVRHVTL